MKHPLLDTPIVDSHAHIFTQDMPLSAHAWSRPKYSYSAEDYLADLDAHGIHFGVIAGISLYGTYNDYMLKKLRQYPRLRGTVNIEPSIELNELAYMKECGVIGVRLFLSTRLTGAVVDLKSAEYQKMLRRIRDLDWHVHFLADDDIYQDSLDILQDAGVKLVIDHFGRADPNKGVDCPRFKASVKAIERGNTWMKISAAYRFASGNNPRTPEAYVEAERIEQELDTLFLKHVSPERLLWGSDAPFVDHEGAVSYQDTLDTFVRAIPNAETRRIISETALKLYFS